MKEQNVYTAHCIKSVGKFYLDSPEDFIKDLLRLGLPWEAHIRDLIERHAWPGTVAIDIGAHIGIHTITMAKRVGPGGQVIAFEPQPKLFHELAINVSLNELENVKAYQCAVGDYRGKIELSPLIKGNEGGTPLKGGTGEFVEILPLDMLHLKNVSFIKIDVEGMEEAVLRGAAQTLQESRPVVVLEIMGGYLPEQAELSIQENIENTIKFLTCLGFSIHRLSAHDYLALPS
jgi:FkbM family methyltransferase